LGPQPLALVWLSILVAKTESLESAFAGLVPPTRQLRDRMHASTHFRPMNRLAAAPHLDYLTISLWVYLQAAFNRSRISH
jgi:hypothetical protein